jgi:hypothetical protein
VELLIGTFSWPERDASQEEPFNAFTSIQHVTGRDESATPSDNNIGWTQIFKRQKE